MGLIRHEWERSTDSLNMAGRHVCAMSTAVIAAGGAVLLSAHSRRHRAERTVHSDGPRMTAQGDMEILRPHPAGEHRSRGRNDRVCTINRNFHS